MTKSDHSTYYDLLENACSVLFRMRTQAQYSVAPVTAGQSIKHKFATHQCCLQKLTMLLNGFTLPTHMQGTRTRGTKAGSLRRIPLLYVYVYVCMYIYIYILLGKRFIQVDSEVCPDHLILI